jgi:hypothetical protein
VSIPYVNPWIEPVSPSIPDDEIYEDEDEG